jgi:hypothetical protein
LACGCISCLRVSDGELKSDPEALIKRLEKLTRSQDRMTLVLWLPSEFWRATLESSGKLAPKAVDGFVKELEPYVVVAVADGQTSILGAVNFAEPESLRVR